jgi:hypothetical protein
MSGQSYLLSASSNNEHFNADCDFAVVTMTPDLLKLLPKLQKTFADVQKRLKDISSFELHGWSASFIRRSTAEELVGEAAFDQMEDQVSNGELFLVPPRPGYELNAEAHADYLVVTGRGIWWGAHPKHSDITVESGQIDWAWFTQCIHCGHAKDTHVKGKCLFSPTNYKAHYAKTDGTTHHRGVRKKQPRKRGLQKV